MMSCSIYLSLLDYLSTLDWSRVVLLWWHLRRWVRRAVA
jgi:hypothetical protein